MGRQTVRKDNNSGKSENEKKGQRHPHSGGKLVDTRSAAGRIQTLQLIADNSTQVRQLNAVQRVVNQGGKSAQSTVVQLARGKKDWDSGKPWRKGDRESYDPHDYDYEDDYYDDYEDDYHDEEDDLPTSEYIEGIDRDTLEYLHGSSPQEKLDILERELRVWYNELRTGVTDFRVSNDLPLVTENLLEIMMRILKRIDDREHLLENEDKIRGALSRVGMILNGPNLSVCVEKIRETNQVLLLAAHRFSFFRPDYALRLCEDVKKVGSECIIQLDTGPLDRCIATCNEALFNAMRFRTERFLVSWDTASRQINEKLLAGGIPFLRSLKEQYGVVGERYKRLFGKIARVPCSVFIESMSSFVQKAEALMVALWPAAVEEEQEDAGPPVVLQYPNVYIHRRVLKAIPGNYYANIDFAALQNQTLTGTHGKDPHGKPQHVKLAGGYAITIIYIGGKAYITDCGKKSRDGSNKYDWEVSKETDYQANKYSANNDDYRQI